ncbi:aspartate-tRNA ligase [Vittaforma corneae ATCC 50505]|uniref:Probable aspartate--tRNA ligase, cytoplasmic n=1 Tax=Vittaforma corneae (strain ATCC 50505) TaxID=993615 RepID=L2GLG7_VITCO|nr:aspartate-tRNA ligase [Vittaforma corneae ATCC 50505]ELA41691.1 aspartate-tRNA ligase [Vittaforma corneae ATCC 50505]
MLPCRDCYLEDQLIGQEARIRGFISTMRTTRSVVFLTVRDRLDTVQAIIVKNKKFNEDLFSLKTLCPECYVECVGKVKGVNPLVFSCTKQNIEIELSSLQVLGPVIEQLPFSLKDASATEEERKENESICAVAYNIRLDNRFLDLRMPQTQAIVRIMDGVMSLFREYLRRQKFIEIKTTKIIQSGSEGGSNLFSIDYFDRKAFLAQSPQLYKQMAIIGGLKRVFEIGHVYRAEQSNINRYLSEFTGLDIEMELEGTYVDVIKFIHAIFVFIFDSLKGEYSRELDIIRKYRSFEDIKYGKDPLVVSHKECVDILKKKGQNISYNEDFNREQEKMLGSEIKEMHGTDIFVIIGYPASERAFYTYVDEDGSTRSYDFILRGEEILSGAQRITSYEKLKAAILRKGIPVESLNNYLEPFKFGAPPHAGCGIGFERLLKSYFGFDDIRYFSLFPRDPNRIYP